MSHSPPGLDMLLIRPSRWARVGAGPGHGGRIDGKTPTTGGQFVQESRRGPEPTPPCTSQPRASHPQTDSLFTRERADLSFVHVSVGSVTGDTAPARVGGTSLISGPWTPAGSRESTPEELDDER